MLIADDKCVGTITPAGWGYRTDTNIAMGFVDPGMADVGTALSVEVIGDPGPARVVEPDLYDPKYEKIRA